MKIVVDTNVLASGVFWAGSPLKILEAFLDGRINLVVSEDIFCEYTKVLGLLGNKYKQDVGEILDMIKLKSSWKIVISLSNQICADPDDDKFIACALSDGIKTIVSGDKLLLVCTGYSDLEIIKPKLFIDKYLRNVYEIT